MEKVLTVNNDIKEKLEDTLLIDGVLKEDINEIINEKYTAFTTSDEINGKMLSIFNNKDFFDIISAISDGYSIGEIISVLLIKKSKVDEFINYISSVDLGIDEVRALNKYTTDSNMLLSRKIGIPKEKIYNSILNKYDTKIVDFLIEEEKIKKIRTFIIDLDYSLPLYKNYGKTISYLDELNIDKDYDLSILNIVKNLDSYYNIDKTLKDLDSALKIRLDSSIVVYRGVKEKVLLENNDNIEELLGQKIGGNYYSSTALLYDESLAKDDDYNVIFEIYVPYGTEAVYLKPFSLKNNKTEELLLNENDLYVTDIDKNYQDKNGNKKILIKAIALSKDKKCYENYSVKNKEDSYSDIRNEINKILETIMDNEIIISNFEVFDGSKRCMYTLKSYIEEEPEKILYKKDFEYNDSFEKEFLEPSIIDFSRRTKIENVTVFPLTNEKSNICLYGKNKAIMNIGNIDNSFANQIKRITPNIHADIYSEKQEQKNNVIKSGNPLKMISARAYAGFTSLLLVTIIVIIIAIIIIMVMMVIR